MGRINKKQIERYLEATKRLTFIEHGAYKLMLDWYRLTEKPLPLDREEIYRLTRAVHEDEKRAVNKILKRYWVRTEAGWINFDNRSEQELERLKWKIKADTHRRWARKQIPALLIRQNNRCGICNKKFQEQSFIEADHIMPLSRAPEQVSRFDLDDIQATHRSCNRRKRNKI